MSTALSGDPAYCNERVAQKMMYEYTMLGFLHGILRNRIRESDCFQPGMVTYAGTGEDTDEQKRTTYAFLESYLMHARVLHDFFYKLPAPGKDDVVAQHFVADWDRRRPALHAYLNKDRVDRLNKALAHLTLKRLDYDAVEKRWNVDAVREAIDQQMEAFREQLIDGRKAWFEDWRQEDEG